MTTLIAGASIVFLVAAACVVVMNWACVIRSQRNKRKGIDRHHSTVSLVSLILAGVAYSAYPFEPKGWIGIVPAVDIGNWILIAGVSRAIISGAFKKEPSKKANGGDIR